MPIGSDNMQARDRKQILIVEDEAINRELLTLVLQESYTLRYAATGEETLKEIFENARSLSLVLLDLNLPDIHGLDVLRKIKVDPELTKIPVIVMTADSEAEVEILAEVEGIVAGLAGIEAVGSRDKIRHRADFGISIDRKYWNLGIGTALLNACMDCAREAEYEQLELSVVAENETAINMYRKAGFEEYGRNPRGFKSRLSGYQELVYMRKEL